MRHIRSAWLLATLALAIATAWAAFAPLNLTDRDEVFAIPKGTWARRMAGNKVEILPREIRLTLGVKDVLVLKNDDDVPQVFSAILLMPGQSFRLPFSTASTYSFACTAHASGQMTVTVAPGPEAGWERLSWRIHNVIPAKPAAAGLKPGAGIQ
jgi:hypothetical protein